MKVSVRIDVGSTTAKAVVLDEAGAVLGRGVTSTRRRHDVTCAAARREALDDARLTLMRRGLAARRLDPIAIERLVQRLEERLRFAEHLVQLRLLDAQLVAVLPGVERRFPGARLAPAVRELLAGVRKASRAPLGTRPRSTSFREVVAGEWARLARAAASPPERPYEALLATLDAALLGVEEQLVDVGLPLVTGVAVRDAVAHGDLPAHEARDVELALDRAACTRLEVVTCVSTAQEVPA